MRVHEGVHLGEQPRRTSGTGMVGFASNLEDHGVVHAERRLHEFLELRGLGQAGELQEQLVHVLPDLIVAGEQAVVGVGTRGPWMIVAGAQVAVAPDSARLAPHDHGQLGVRLVADDAVHDVRSGLLQPVRQLDVGLFVETRAQLNDDRHVLAGVGGGNERVDDR